MYQKPDFIKVSVKVKDVFANYGTKSCPMDEGDFSALVASGCKDIFTPNTTFIAEGWGIGCYSTNNP